MLLEYGLKNYFSFKEGVTISFQLDSNCPPEITQGQNFTPVLCVKGANASGKTNILKALGFIARFATSSFAYDPENLIPLDGFFDSKNPSEFFVEFSVDGTIYRYELEATEHEVRREAFYRKQLKKTKLFERINLEIHDATKEFSILKTIKIRKNASIISTANQYEITELKVFYDFFKSIHGNVSSSGEQLSVQIPDVSLLLSKHKEMHEFVEAFIKRCDVGITNIQIVEYKKADGNKEFLPQFIHTADGKDHKVSVYTESSGTKALFVNLLSYKLVLDIGGVLILDEFDIYLHPHILPELINLFLLPEYNPKNAQLIFTTHNSEILNTLGRYRTYLVNKVENESFAYRLDEISGDVLRNDRPILPAYNDGKIGGIPRL